MLAGELEAVNKSEAELVVRLKSIVLALWRNVA